MEFEFLNNKLKEFSNKLSADLKQELINNNHVKTGKLLNSISVNVINSNGNINIEINALDYIKKLEGGNFLQEFLNKKTEELKTFISTEIKKNITKELLG